MNIGHMRIGLAFGLAILFGSLVPSIGYGQTKPQSASDKAMQLLSDADNGHVCGGIAGIGCEAGTFCEMPAGTCTKADGQGRCVVLMSICSRIFRPVCGCDRRTYSNDCERQTARVGKAHDGKCS